MMIYIGIPQLIMICLHALNIGTHLAKNGEPREGEYSFVVSLIGTAISVGLLWWGGFFSN